MPPKPAKGRPHILVECPDMIPSVKLGVLDIIQALEEKQKCSVQFVKTHNIHKTHLQWCDILISVRGSESTTLEITKSLKAAGRFIIYFLDDDLLNIPEDISCSEYYQNEDIQENIKEILGLADVLWCVNENIANKYSQFMSGYSFLGKVPIVMSPPQTAVYDKIKILYAGSKDHYEAVRNFILPAVLKICKEFGDAVSMTFIGVNPGISECSNVFFYEYFHEYSEYKQFISNSGFSIGLAPIFTTDFYNAKYHNKYIEYSSIHAMGIYTDTNPYRRVIIDSYNGLLTENHVDSWYNSIRRAILDTVLRNYCISNAVKQMEEEYKPEKVILEVESIIKELTSFHAPNIKIHYSPVRISNILSYYFRIKKIFEKNGWRGFSIIISKLIERLRRIRSFKKYD